jgi:uncharacterized protein involved in type VI secretion and phage assembly
MVVEEDLAQPSMLVLRFHDPEFTLIDGSTFALGKEVEISVAPPSGAPKKLLTAEVTSLEIEFEQFEKLYVVRAYDKSHRLHRGRKTKSYLKQKDSDIASAVVSGAGLQAQVEATSDQHEYVLQNNQTDMEFLRDRAARVGYQVRFVDGKVKFGKTETSPAEATEQEWGITLLSFQARLSPVGQPNSVEVRGWDPKTKKALVGTASTPAAPSAIGDGKTGGAAAKTAFSAQAAFIITDLPVGTQGEATKIAQAALNEMALDYLTAEGTCFGEPSIKAGVLVPIKGVSVKYSGKYFVTAVRHEYNHDRGYMTTFFAHGRRPNSILGVVSRGGNGAGSSIPDRHLIHGVEIGIVTNNNDPDNLGRVKVKLPWMATNEGTEQESDWARVVILGAGKQRGIWMLPEVNDEVLLAFEQGDPSQPFVIGGLWNGKDAAPDTTSNVRDGNGVNVRVIKTRVGHMIEFNDKTGAGADYITIKTKGGQLITIGDGDKKLEIKSANHTILLDDQGRAVKITSGGTVEISGSGNSLKFTESGIELTGSGGALKIAPAGVELGANANLTCKANANVDVQANAMLNVKTSAILSLQGSLVKIN